jgi:hypothetical protein
MTAVTAQTTMTINYDARDSGAIALNRKQKGEVFHGGDRRGHDEPNACRGGGGGNGFQSPGFGIGCPTLGKGGSLVADPIVGLIPSGRIFGLFWYGSQFPGHVIG